jgi:two-component system, response regulator PdtaR
MNVQHMTTAPTTVLIVEDEPLVRLIGSDLLTDAGFHVIEACDSDEALQILDVRSDVEVVFTDVDMPGAMDGFALASEIERRWPQIGVLVTSGRRAPSQGTSRTSRFVAKPYSAGTLVNNISACVRR